MSADVDLAVRKPGRPRDARTDVAILEAVLDLVANAGLTHLSMDAVAAKAGVAKATIYRRWPTKEALVLDAWRTLIAPHEPPDTGSLRGDVHTLLDRLLDTVSDGGFDVMAQVTAAARTDPALAEGLREFLATRRGPMRVVLERAVARGELARGVDLELVYDTIMGPIFYRLLLSRAPVDHDVLNAVVDIVLAGVANDPTR
jgi:AcrR family transcriptional regulator